MIVHAVATQMPWCRQLDPCNFTLWTCIPVGELSRLGSAWRRCVGVQHCTDVDVRHVWEMARLGRWSMVWCCRARFCSNTVAAKPVLLHLASQQLSRPDVLTCFRSGTAAVGLQGGAAAELTHAGLYRSRLEGFLGLALTCGAMDAAHALAQPSRAIAAPRTGGFDLALEEQHVANHVEFQMLSLHLMPRSG